MTEPIGIGAALRHAREAQGLEIDDVAQQLKFAPRQIESLEHERFERLPGPTIARGMVRNYARLLKLDPEPLLARMAARLPGSPDPERIAAPLRTSVPFSDGAKRSTLIYAGFSIGVLLLVGAVAYEWQQEKAAPQFVAPAQEQRAEGEKSEAPRTLESVVLAAVEDKAPVNPPAPESAPRPEAAAPKPAAPPPQAAAKPQAAPPPDAGRRPETVARAEKREEKPVQAGMQRLVLRADREAWIEVKDGTGQMLVSWLAPAGSERVVRGRPPFELVIGNAAYVKLTYNDKPIDLRPHTKVEVARLTLK